MENELLAMIRRYDMLRPGDTLVCAVSGGADSVAMLFALYLLKDKLGIRLEAAHYNHKLRGEESDRDEAFVRDLCRGYGIPLHLGSGRVVPGEKGLEAAAREARYAFFDTLPGKLATAHTADDNAETVLMRMVRGTGLRGLGGIQPVRGRIIRPMLLVTRRQVRQFLEEYCLSHVEDSSNAADAFLRNRLRHRVLPQLEAENPRFSRNLSEMALRLRLDEEALCGDMDFSEGLDVETMRSMAEAEGSRVIGAFLESRGVREPEAAHIRQVWALLRSPNPSARGCFPGGVVLSRRYGRLDTALTEPAPEAVTLNCPGITELPQWGLRVICRPSDRGENGPNVFTVSPEGLPVLRSRQPGDSIRLRGGSRSLKKLFIDRRVPAETRDSVPVVADSLGILGVGGIGANLDRVRPGHPAIEIRLEKI